MRIFVTDDFQIFMDENNITEIDVRKSAKEVESGLFDANLGGCVLKKRIAPSGKGKRGATRSVIAFNCGDKIFYMDGWAKNDVPKKGKEIPNSLLAVYKLLARNFLKITDEQIKKELKLGQLIEVKYDE